MSAMGTKRTCGNYRPMSVHGGEADIPPQAARLNDAGRAIFQKKSRLVAASNYKRIRLRASSCHDGDTP